MEISIFGKQYYLNKALILVATVILIIIAGILGYFLRQVYQPLSEPVIEKAELLGRQTDGGQVEESLLLQEPIEEIKVYVVGCVRKPGVVTLNKGSIIDDAIRAAGGASEKADLENINLAYPLNDNTMLRIRAREVGQTEILPATPANNGEGKAAGTKSQATSSIKQSASKDKATATSVQSEMNSGVEIIKDSLGAVSIDNKKSEKEDSDTLVNINTASQSQLESLPNVGPATAKAIIEYREKNGGFKKITDIMKITGIKQKTFDKLKDLICI